MAVSFPINYSFDANIAYVSCEINGTKFAFFNKIVQGQETLSLDFSDYNIVLLEPLEAEENILVKAISVIALSTLWAKKGHIEIHASEKIMMLGTLIQSKGGECKLKGEKGVYYLSIPQLKKELILGGFKEGIENSKIAPIITGLAFTYSAVEDPTHVKETPIKTHEVLEFFNI